MSNRVYRYRRNSGSSNPSLGSRNSSLRSLRDTIFDQLDRLGLRVDDDDLLADLEEFDENELFAILGLFGLLGYFALLGLLSSREDDPC